MLDSEKRSLFRFLAIYFSSTFLLFTLSVITFYYFEKHQIIHNQQDRLELYSKRVKDELRKLHSTFNQDLIYPKSDIYNSAIYDLNKEYIFGTFNPKNIKWDREYYQIDNKIFYIDKIKPYYLGASYVVVEKKIDYTPIEYLFDISIIILIIGGVIFLILGLFLGRLFTAPMRNFIYRMNKFIEDTTHELNTPISTILTNIELINTLYNCEGKNEMKRLEIASKTLSRLYEDLTYLRLNHNYHRDIKKVNISELLNERVEFFQTLIEAKSLDFILNITQEIYIDIDKNDAIRLIDNLLSNSIKYNFKNGDLLIILNSDFLLIKNSANGIDNIDIKMIKERFYRANGSEGGFGIGLDIISQIAKRYSFEFDISINRMSYVETIIKW